LNALEVGLYALLTADSTLTAMLTDGTAGIHNTHAPRDANLPYMVFGLQASADDDRQDTKYLDYHYRVKGVSATSKKSAGQIADRAEVTLDRATPTVTGYNVLWCRRESEFSYVEYEADGDPIYHVGGIYRIRMNKSSS